MKLDIRDLETRDRGYALASWRESHKAAPGVDKVPWAYYKREYGVMFSKLIDDPATSLIGAYSGDKLVGWLAVTYGKRVSTLHWVQVKYQLEDERTRRQGVMTALVDAADLGSPFIYTLRGARRKVELPDGTKTKSFDEVLAAWFKRRGQTATFVPLQEWLR